MVGWERGKNSAMTFGPFAGEAPALQHRSFVDGAVFGEAGQIEKAGVDQVCLSFQNQVSEDFACGWGVHDAVAAETVGAKEPGYFRNLAEDGMVVRRYLVKTGPSAFGIDGEVFEYRNAGSGAGEDFLDEGRFEIRVVAGSFFRIVPSE